VETWQLILLIVVAVVLAYVAWKLHQLFAWINHKAKRDAQGRCLAGETPGLYEWVSLATGGPTDGVKPPDPPGGM
jgi:hypothetical protein